jgi:hypothetical protein
LRIEFNQRYSDILLFSLEFHFLSRHMQLWAAGFSGLTVAIMVAAHASPVSMVKGAAIVYAVFWLVWTLCVINYFHAVGMKKSVGPKIIELRDDALFEETPWNQTHHYWPNIAKIVRRPGSFRVYLCPSGTAHIIPMRAFRNRGERKTFWLALQQHWESGKGQVQRPDLIHEFSPEATPVPENPGPDTMPRHLLGACVLYMSARGAMAVLASQYESGYFRVSSPVGMLLFCILVLLFTRRVRWTWRLIAPVAFGEIVVNSIFFPRFPFSRGYLEWSQFFTALLIAAACVIVWSRLWSKQTRCWFQRP